MHRDFQGFALENEGIFHFGMPLAGCGGLWYSDFVGIWHGCVNASWVVLPTQLIPARGRKPRAFQNGWSFKRDTTYPRKGTKRAIRGHHLLRYNVKILRFVSRLRPWGGGPICLSREDIVHFPSMFGEYEMPTTGGHMGPPLRWGTDVVGGQILWRCCRL